MIKYSTEDFVKNLVTEEYSGFFLGADVGGTYTRTTVAGIKERKPVLIFSLKFETSFVDSIIPIINETLDYAEKKHGITIRATCIGSAGIISEQRDFVKLTNAKWSINKKEIIDKTYLNDVFLINDFVALGYGINLLDENDDIFKIRSDKEYSSNYETKAVIGAGTGLGKCILNYDEKNKFYKPIESEGGNSDFPCYNEFEAELVEYIKKIRNISKPLVYEELLSGRGIVGIYQFLREKNHEKTKVDYEIEKSEDPAEVISNYRNEDETCKEAFDLFSRFYGRCAKNFALDTLSKGGMYIAGGIAAKNKEIFQSSNFIDEFNEGNRREEFLRNVPIYVILNPHTSLLGACYAARIKTLKEE